MITFRQKEFGAKVRAVKEMVKKSPVLVTSTGTLVLSGANLGVNVSRQKKDEAYQKEHLQATKDLTNAMSGATDSINKTSQEMIKFREKKEEPKTTPTIFGKRKLFSR